MLFALCLPNQHELSITTRPQSLMRYASRVRLDHHDGWMLDPNTGNVVVLKYALMTSINELKKQIQIQRMLLYQI